MCTKYHPAARCLRWQEFNRFRIFLFLDFYFSLWITFQAWLRCLPSKVGEYLLASHPKTVKFIWVGLIDGFKWFEYTFQTEYRCKVRNDCHCQFVKRIVYEWRGISVWWNPLFMKIFGVILSLYMLVIGSTAAV